MRVGRVVALVLLALLAGGCGGGDTSPSSGAKEKQQGPSAKNRAGDLLDDWSDQLLVALMASQQRGQAAQAGDRKAYEKADADLRPALRKVKKFAPQGRAVMSRFPDDSLRRAVVADGDAWQEWALAIDQPGEISPDQGRKIADLGAEAIRRHEQAYAAAGRKPPPAFRRRPDQS